MQYIGMLYRDNCETVWLLIFYAFQTMVTINYIQQNPTEMHWYILAVIMQGRSHQDLCGQVEIIGFTRNL